MEPIAKICLAPGNIGFYDPLSRIHLTLGAPTAYVPSGTNCASLRRNVRNGVIRLLEGTLGPDVAEFKFVSTDSGMKLVSNAEEASRPVYAEDTPVPDATQAESKEAVAQKDEAPASDESDAEVKEEEMPEPETTDDVPMDGEEKNGGKKKNAKKK